MIIKTNLIPSGFDAMTLWPFILVRPTQADNKGLIEHELVHYREQSFLTPIWWLRYLLIKSFRLNAEVRAYKRQIEVNGISIFTAASYLTKYHLNITVDDAIKLLTV